MLLPAAHQVIAILPDHAHHFRNFLRGVLQVRIHGNDDVSLGSGEALEQGGRLAVVPPETDAPHETPGRAGSDDSPVMAGLTGHLLHHLPRAVRGTIVHKNELIGETLQGAVDPGLELREGLGLVV